MPRWVRRTALPIALTGIFALSVTSGQVAEQIVHKAFPSVVLLVMRDANGHPVSLGSGFFVRDGIVATNLHVVKGTAGGYAKLVGQTTKYDIAGVVGVDGARDLALLVVKGTSAPSLVIGDSHQAKVGQGVYVIGNPKGLEGTVSEGIISGVRQVDSGTLLQITAPISPGSSGGPVLDAYGQVIGVAAATLKGGQNLNFAVPSFYLASLLGNMKPLTPLVAEERTRSLESKRNPPATAETIPKTEWSLKHPHQVACAQGAVYGRSYADAEQECRMALLDAPDTMNASAIHFMYGEVLRGEQKWNGAIAEYNASLRLRQDGGGDDDYSVHQGIGRSLEGRGELDAAITEYRLALTLAQSQVPEQFSGMKLQYLSDIELAGVHADLGVALLQKNDLDGAVAEFQEVVRLRPADASGYSLLARTLEMKGDHAAAVEQCRTAFELTPSDEAFSGFCKTILDQLKK